MTDPIVLDPGDWRRYLDTLDPDALAEANRQVGRLALEADHVLRDLGAQGPFGPDGGLSGVSLCALGIHDRGRVEIVLFHRNADGHNYPNPNNPGSPACVRLWIQDIRLPPHVVEAIARKLEQ